MEYKEILSEIAKIQWKLLTYSMDWESRNLIMTPVFIRSGLFGLKRSLSSDALKKQELLEKLEKLKKEAEAHLKSTAFVDTYHWWQISWEQLEPQLLFHLSEMSQDNEWRFETRWECVEIREGYDLFFHEEGHLDNFSGINQVDFFKTSKYSAEERSELMKRYKESQEKKDCNDWFRYYGKGIYSRDTKTLYNSIDTYLHSAEHYLDLESQREEFENSLYTEHQLNRIEVRSQSIHYCATYYVGKYHISKQGYLDGFDLKPYLLEKWRGDLPIEFKEYRQKKDAVVASMAHLADLSEIACIPMELFGEKVWNGVSSESEALFYAELLTSVAKKIRCNAP